MHVMTNIGFDSRSNPCEESGDDVDRPTNTKDPLHIPNGPIIRSKAKALIELVVQVSVKIELRDPLDHQEEALVHLLHVHEGLNSPLFRSCSFDNKTVNFVLVLASLVM
jgi:hypothetical protein